MEAGTGSGTGLANIDEASRRGRGSYSAVEDQGYLLSETHAEGRDKAANTPRFVTAYPLERSSR
jgi:hypothetical protein